MRLDVNLATHPYRDYSQQFVRLTAALVISALLTLALVFVAIRDWRSTRELAEQLNSVKEATTELQKQEAISQAILDRPENRGTRDRSQFVNGLIARKAFSWTQVFADLEKLMPTRVHLVSISPELDQDNQLAVKLAVAGDSRDKAIELVHNLEESRHFRNPHVTEEQAQSPQGGDTIQFQIAALYVPELTPVADRAPHDRPARRRKP